jgi:hypothetical protein
MLAGEVLSHRDEDAWKRKALQIYKSGGLKLMVLIIVQSPATA